MITLNIEDKEQLKDLLEFAAERGLINVTVDERDDQEFIDLASFVMQNRAPQVREIYHRLIIIEGFQGSGKNALVNEFLNAFSPSKLNASEFDLAYIDTWTACAAYYRFVDSMRIINKGPVVFDMGKGFESDQWIVNILAYLQDKVQPKKTIIVLGQPGQISDNLYHEAIYVWSIYQGKAKDL